MIKFGIRKKILFSILLITVFVLSVNVVISEIRNAKTVEIIADRIVDQGEKYLLYG